MAILIGAAVLIGCSGIAEPFNSASAFWLVVSNIMRQLYIMSEPADLVEEQDARGGALLRFTGTMSIAHIAELDRKLAAILGPVATLDI